MVKKDRRKKYPNQREGRNQTAGKCKGIWLNLFTVEAGWQHSGAKGDFGVLIMRQACEWVSSTTVWVAWRDSRASQSEKKRQSIRGKTSWQQSEELFR